MKRLAAFAALSVTFVHVPAVAQVERPDFSTGNGLYEMCTSNDPNDRMMCTAYIQGFALGAQASAWEARRPAPFCTPENVTLGQLRDVVVNGLRDHPEARHMESIVLVMMLLQRAFPCAPTAQPAH